MSTEKANPEIKWKKTRGNDCLCFTFNGTLTKDDAEVATEEWRELFESRKNEKILLVWQCLEMKGYEPMARKVWQDATKEFKNQIDEIWLISNSIIIQAGAKIMSLFTSYDIRVAKSEEEISLTE